MEQKEKFTPEQMRNVKLSGGTIEFLIAYKMAEESADKAYQQVEEMWGVDQAQKMIEPVFDAVHVMKKEILNLMIQHIDEKLGTVVCTEI